MEGKCRKKNRREKCRKKSRPKGIIGQSGGRIWCQIKGRLSLDPVAHLMNTIAETRKKRRGLCEYNEKGFLNIIQFQEMGYIIQFQELGYIIQFQEVCYKVSRSV